jgi:hypothetical protein
VNTIKVEERFLIVSHVCSDDRHRIVGSAYKSEDEDHYRFFLRMFPGTPYYLVPHRERSWEFLVFSGREKRANGSSRFFCKIGSAIHLPEKNVIEIHLPDLRQVYYLRMEPEDFHYNARKEVA